MERHEPCLDAVRPRAEPVVVHFDDLVSKPAETVTGAIEALDLKLPSKGDQKIPTFDELRAQYPTFFRKGKAGDWKNWFTDQQERTFWEDSQDIMQQLGFDS